MQSVVYVIMIKAYTCDHKEPYFVIPWEVHSNKTFAELNKKNALKSFRKNYKDMSYLDEEGIEPEVSILKVNYHA